MLDEILYKEQLEKIKDYVKKNQYISLAKIKEIFSNLLTDELLDDVVEFLENDGVEITKDSEEVPSEEELLTESVDDEFEAFVEDLEEDDDLNELVNVVDSEIKVADFDEITNTGYSADDPVKMYLHDIGQIELLTITQESEYARTYQESLMCKEKINSYNKQGKTIPEAEMRVLEDKIRKGEFARKILIEANLRLVVSIAKRYLGRGLLLLDLIQEGNMGLMKAVNKFDPTKGFKFSTYATWWIRQAITRAIADNARTIRIPVHMVETINKLVRTTRRLTQEKRREPTPEEIAADQLFRRRRSHHLPRQSSRQLPPHISADTKQKTAWRHRPSSADPSISEQGKTERSPASAVVLPGKNNPQHRNKRWLSSDSWESSSFPTRCLTHPNLQIHYIL